MLLFLDNDIGQCESPLYRIQCGTRRDLKILDDRGILICLEIQRSNVTEVGHLQHEPPE